MDKLIAYHGKKTSDDIIEQALSAGVIYVDFDKGEAWSNRWPRPLGCHNQKGYKVCTLHFQGYRIQAKLHRIIWIAANGVPDKVLVIDHINGEKDDNRLSNLRLTTNKGNAENRRDYSGASNPSAKITSDTAESIRAEHQLLKSYSKVANKFNVSRSLVAQIVRRELWIN